MGFGQGCNIPPHTTINVLKWKQKCFYENKTRAVDDSKKIRDNFETKVVDYFNFYSFENELSNPLYQLFHSFYPSEHK